MTDLIPAVTAAQMAEVDRLMIEAYGIQLIQMMETAGRALAEQARRMMDGATGKHVLVLCGAGNNGGGGMVAARHLHNWGAAVHVWAVGFDAAGAGKLKETPELQWRILDRMGLTRRAAIDPAEADLIVDAIIGYGLRGDPRDDAAAWIERANASGRPILSLDVPSGLDATTGVPGRPCIRAAATLTLALPKTGLTAGPARPFVGELFVADIGVPPELYRGLGLDPGPLFDRDTIVRAW